MIQKKNLRSYFPNYAKDGAIFTLMEALGAPWDNGIGRDMDMAYFAMYSGIKEPSEFVTLNSVDGTANEATLSQVLWSMFGSNWKRLWDAFSVQYNPINNYKVDESTTRAQTDGKTVNRTNDYTSTVEGTIAQTGSSTTNGTTTLAHGLQVKTDGEVDSFTHGFNSTEKVPTNVQIDTQTQANSGNDVTTVADKTDTTNDTTNNTGITDKTIEATTDNTKIDETITKAREGNVGQNSFQELLQQEFNLWRWNFYQQVFEDVDKFLVLSVYDPCSSVNYTTINKEEN